MRIMELAVGSNGSHRNQTYGGVLPEGWAVIPDELATPCFPFGEAAVEVIEGVLTVVSWTPGEMPSPEPVASPATSIEARLAAIEEALNLSEVSADGS